MPKELNVTQICCQHDLAPNQNGKLRLNLVQASSATSPLGKRVLPPARLTNDGLGSSLEEQADVERILKRTTPGALTVVSYHPGLGACEAELKAAGIGGAVVALAGLHGRKNVTFVATAGNLYKQEKISLSSEDEVERVLNGTHLYLYVGENDTKHEGYLRWAVLNCHEYTHVDILQVLLEHRIELLVVVSFNTATRLYWQYALADVHRLFCYVVIANIAELGGSAVFAPFRRVGEESKAKFSAGGQVFGSRGPGKFEVDIDLDIALLRRLRRDFAEQGFRCTSAGTDLKLEPMVPSQHHMFTGDNVALGPPYLEGVDDLIAWPAHDVIRVAVAQLDHIGFDAYVSTGYRLEHHEGYEQFCAKLERWLKHVESECNAKTTLPGQRQLDLLVFPEVFVPRPFLPSLQAFSNKIGTTIIAGVDYPPAHNVNECMILRPNVPPVSYRKITRSQYDGMKPDGERMPMERGDRLLRLVGADKQGAGILICYDFSHLDLMHALNLDGRLEPLELVVVVAHNPFSELYRSCCIADSHRFYQYVVMCNVSEFGGSGIFGPMRTPGARQVLAEAGKGAETVLFVDLDLKRLRDARAASDQSLLANDDQRHSGVIKQRIVKR